MMDWALPHGTLKLPVFFPDGTRGVVRCVDPRDLEDAAVPGLVLNTYHLLTKPGRATLKALGGLHAFMGWNRPILTDSGGFQVFSLIRENARYGEIRANEIVFRADGDRDKLTLSPEKCVQAQFAFGSDVMMCLDYCTHPDDSYELNERSVETTVRWAKLCKAEFEKQLAARRISDAERPQLFAIIQGGGYMDLRTQCADALKAMGFDGYGFGGWPLDSDGKLVMDILAHTARSMPDETPKYAMGLGTPQGIVACHAAGYNVFDCVIPTREARHGRLYRFHDRYASLSDVALDAEDFAVHYYAKDDKYWRDTRPISELCDCPCCRNHTRAYLRHLFMINDPLSLRLATIHNLRFYTQLMDLLRERA